jgi:hypothetical protein
MQQESPTVLTATEARQATTGHNVRYVLAASLLLALLAFACIYLFVM